MSSAGRSGLANHDHRNVRPVKSMIKADSGWLCRDFFHVSAVNMWLESCAVEFDERARRRSRARGCCGWSGQSRIQRRRARARGGRRRRPSTFSRRALLDHSASTRRFGGVADIRYGVRRGAAAPAREPGPAAPPTYPSHRTSTPSGSPGPAANCSSPMPSGTPSPPVREPANAGPTLDAVS